MAEDKTAPCQLKECPGEFIQNKLYSDTLLPQLTAVSGTGPPGLPAAPPVGEAGGAPAGGWSGRPATGAGSALTHPPQGTATHTTVQVSYQPKVITFSQAALNNSIAKHKPISQSRFS